MNQYANDFTRTVEIYYDDLKRYKPLPRIKERRLIKLAKKGNIKAKNELLQSNLRFVFDVARHYTGRGVSISDLISDGNMALVKAIDKFDETQDVKFISYAVWWVKQAMLESIRKTKLIPFVDIEPNEDNDEFIESKVCDDSEDDDEECDSFDFLVVENNDENEKRQRQKELILKLMSTLNEREKDVIESFYGLNKDKSITLTEIGKKYGITTERVRQIKESTMKKLRSSILCMDEFEEFSEL